MAAKSRQTGSELQLDAVAAFSQDGLQVDDFAAGPQQMQDLPDLGEPALVGADHSFARSDDGRR